MKRNTKTKSIAIATALTTLLSASAVLADTTSSNTVETPKISQTQTCDAHGWFKSRLDSLVSSGTLTQAQEDAIQTKAPMVPKVNVDKGEFNRGHHDGQFVNVLDGLVKAGTITQAQADAIKGALTPAKGDNDATPTPPKEDGTTKVDVKTVLDGLVKADTITQVQADAIQSAIKPAVEAVPAVEAKSAVEAVPAVEARSSSRG